MSDTLKILKALMKAKELNAHDLYKLSGVTPPTTNRFLTGRHAEPKEDTIRRWARALGVTEAQLRGTEPIKGIDLPVEVRGLKDMLSLEEYNHVYKMKTLPKEKREIMYRLAEILSEELQAARRQSEIDRRNRDVFPNNQLRAGECRHQAPPNKKRIKDPSYGRRQSEAS